MLAPSSTIVSKLTTSVTSNRYKFQVIKIDGRDRIVLIIYQVNLIYSVIILIPSYAKFINFHQLVICAL